MNLFCHHKKAPARRPVSCRQGFTLVEMVIATGLAFSVVIIGFMSVNYLGMREDQLIESKAGASQTSREAISDMLTDVRSTKGYYVGTFSSGTFTACAYNAAQQGGALFLYPIVNGTNGAVDTSKTILYYFDTDPAAASNGRLWRSYYTNGVQQTAQVIASNLINTLYFTSETFLGATQATRTFKGVIHTTLQFCQFQYPTTLVGSNCIFDYYRIDCRATPHLPDGP